MAKPAEAAANTTETEEMEQTQQTFDSKYRLIIVAAKRSKQIQRGAHPRVDSDPQKHKPTRIALEEVMRGKVPFTIDSEEANQ
ncbi:MAG: DNA-directed RNA polymerase subunit omega [Acidobacteria bacterium 13_1_20CM_3_53_8]|nr:MAG: DNA-directed RNA polymerase subunit omega [Acidobacteria bacterium 13_1_20CM_3_53_8]